MDSKIISLSLLILGAVISLSPSQVCAQNSSYYPYVFARGSDRQVLRNMPIEQRPSRPMHFYGNAVRRNRVLASSNQRPFVNLSRGVVQVDGYSLLPISPGFGQMGLPANTRPVMSGFEANSVNVTPVPVAPSILNRRR